MAVPPLTPNSERDRADARQRSGDAAAPPSAARRADPGSTAPRPRTRDLLRYARSRARARRSRAQRAARRARRRADGHAPGRRERHPARRRSTPYSRATRRISIAFPTRRCERRSSCGSRGDRSQPHSKWSSRARRGCCARTTTRSASRSKPGNCGRRAGRVPVCTIALRSQHGDPGYPAQLALELLDALPLRTSRGHPVERARGLLLGDGARSRKAEVVEIAADATLEELIVAVAANCLRQISENEEAGRARRRSRRRAPTARRRAPPALCTQVLRSGAAGATAQRVARVALPGSAARSVLLAISTCSRRAAGSDRRSPRARTMRRSRASTTKLARTSRRQLRAGARGARDRQRFTRLVLEIQRWLARCAWREQPLSAESASLFLPARDSRRGVSNAAPQGAQARASPGDGAAGDPPPTARQAEEAALRRRVLSAACSRARRRSATRAASRALQDALGAANDAVVAERVAAEIAANDSAAAPTRLRRRLPRAARPARAAKSPRSPPGNASKTSAASGRSDEQAMTTAPVAGHAPSARSLRCGCSPTRSLRSRRLDRSARRTRRVHHHLLACSAHEDRTRRLSRVRARAPSSARSPASPVDRGRRGATRRDSAP